MNTLTQTIAIYIVLLGMSCQSNPPENQTNKQYEEQPRTTNDSPRAYGLVGLSELNIEPIISVSARGWTLKPRPAPGKEWCDTIVVNPKGQEFNIGATQYPDWPPTKLWIVEVKELGARFLLIQVPPMASGTVVMPVVYVDENDKPTVAGEINQRWEFGPEPADMDNPGYNPKVMMDGGEQLLRDVLFEDIDHDGKPELVEDDVWKDGGYIRYYKFTKAKKFVLKKQIRVGSVE